jgi:hypothetical protein
MVKKKVFIVNLKGGGAIKLTALAKHVMKSLYVYPPNALMAKMNRQR